MKSAVIFACVLAAAYAQFDQYDPSRYVTPGPVVNRPLSSERDAQTVNYVNDIYPDGSFKYAFNTDNGIAAEAQGTPKAFNSNPPVAPVVHTGQFSWYSPEGKPIVIAYSADENGYQASGDAIPTPPPIPAAIQRALEYIARNPQPQYQSPQPQYPNIPNIAPQYQNVPTQFQNGQYRPQK